MENKQNNNIRNIKSTQLLCCDCRKPAKPLYINSVDSSVKCELCAINKYKTLYPLTWNMPLLNQAVFIDIVT